MDAAPPHLPHDQYLEFLAVDGPALRSGAAKDLSAGVPGCPEWDVAALVAHVGTVYRMVDRILRTRAQEFVRRPEAEAPPEGSAVLEWYDAGLDALRGDLVGIGPEVEVWNLSGTPGPAAFWFRRMAQETAVHRWDAQSATGEPNPIDSDLAADGIAELLETLLPARLARGAPPPFSGSLHVHTTDVSGEWTVRASSDGLDVERGHAKGDAAIRGPASEVLLALWGRPTMERVEVLGDRAVVERWREQVRL